jgi:site-specific DNA-methyltransferase (adenine-specific)
LDLDTVVCGDALEIMAAMPADSVDLIAVDPVKGDWWDRQWDTPAGFLDWIGQLCEGWHRILRPNGSLYVFASHDMAGRVESKIREYFAVLNVITWAKPDFSTKAEMFRKEWLRSFFPSSERIIFAEHYGSDGYAKGEAGYTAKCDELRGFVFEPLRAYLDEERRRAGVNFEQVRQIVGCADGSREL